MNQCVILSVVVVGWAAKDLLAMLNGPKEILRLPARPPTHAQDDTSVHLSLYRRSRRSPAQDDRTVPVLAPLTRLAARSPPPARRSPSRNQCLTARCLAG